MLLQEVAFGFSEHLPSLLEVPLVRGFLYEDKFFNWIRTEHAFTVKTKTGEMIIPVTRVLNQEVVEKDMKSGILYHL